MNDMWEALEKYQPYAERHGFGPQWRQMTTERTADAAWAAAVAARATDAPEAAWAAARGAAVAAAAWGAPDAAIKYINEAIAKEAPR